MQWIVSEEKLGPDQRDVISEIGKTSRSVWIKGHAGSGKSVLLLHSLKDYLARNPNAVVCIVVFTRSLVDLLSTGLKQLPFLADKNIPVLTIYEMKNHLEGPIRYDAIFCDEIQDVPIQLISDMKAGCKQLILAGDSEQSIYTSVPGFNSKTATPAEITASVLPIEKNLTMIYRLTASVLGILKNVFTSLHADKTNLAKEDTEIKLYRASSLTEELKFCWSEAKQTNRLRTSDVSAILINGHDRIVEFANTVCEIEGKPAWFRKNVGNLPFYEMLNRHFEEHGLPLMYVGNGTGSLIKADEGNKIILMTYHSSKGLDFNYVYLPMVNYQMFIHSDVDVNALLLVALSRSKSGLFISYTKELYPPLRRFLTGLVPKPVQSASSDEVVF